MPGKRKCCGVYRSLLFSQERFGKCYFIFGKSDQEEALGVRPSGKWDRDHRRERCCLAYYSYNQDLPTYNFCINELSALETRIVE